MCSHPALLLPAVSPTLPLYHFMTTDMVRTRGGSRLRPRVRFSTPEEEEQAPTTAIALILSLRSLKGSGGIRRGWDLGPLPQCLREDPGGPGPPNGPGHQARGSPRHLPHEPIKRDQSPVATSLDMLAAAATVLDPPPPRE